MYTRREFGKITLAGLPLSLAFGPIDPRVEGVRIGVQSYSFRTLPLTGHQGDGRDRHRRM